MARQPRNVQSGYSAGTEAENYEDSSLIQHMQGRPTTLCLCWKITPQSPILYPSTINSLGFTTHTKDLTLPGHAALVFTSKRAMAPTTAEQSAGLAAPNLEVNAVFDSAGITSEAIAAGWWDAAEYESFLVNYKATGMGELLLQSGRLGEIREQGRLFTAEGLGLAANTQQQVGEVTLATCRVRKFCDPRCGLDAADFTVTGAVTARQAGEDSNIEFYDSSRTESATIFPGGDLTFTSGPLSGMEIEIKEWDATNKKFTLALPMPYAIEPGVTYSALFGCDRKASSCQTRTKADGTTVNNKENFQGEDTIPGLERAYQVPAAT
jgi:uncharacterized phage protein (TIGR02218 family)